ncbi:MAG: toll/interleukin-1 receptor domain-containing protein [Actinomycetes bacterium]
MEYNEFSQEPFDLFISYNHNSLDLARHFYYTAIANGINPWMDEAELTPGTHFPSRAEQGIKLSKRFFLIATKAAMSSAAVRKEIGFALEKHRKDSSFKILIYIHDGVDLGDYKEANLKEFIYVEQSSNSHFPPRNPFPVMSQLIESITGKNMLVAFLNQSFASAVNVGGATSNMSTTDYLVPVLSGLIIQIKTFLNNTALGYRPEETFDSIRKLLAFTPLDNVAMLQPGWIALGSGVFENLHPTRLRIPPRIQVHNLPSEVTWREISNDEVITRIQFVDQTSGDPHLGPIPFWIELDAEL